MGVLSTGTPDSDDPEPTRDEPATPARAFSREDRPGQHPEEGEEPTPAEGGGPPEDEVTESSEESFPASDPPTWSAAPSTGPDAGERKPEHPGLGRVVEDRDTSARDRER